MALPANSDATRGLGWSLLKTSSVAGWPFPASPVPMPEVMTKVVFSRGLTDGSHVRRFDVERAPAEGWHVREERDAEVKQVTYADWHRVELAIRGFSAEASQLTQKGWRIFH